jgi:dipeptidyl aminopeptidase/acylaminoacyl peptidase
MGKKILVPVMVILLVGAAAYTLVRKTVKSIPLYPAAEKLKNSVITPTPTPFPFEELTIPYERRQKFDSQLTRGEVLFKNPVYTAYRASYVSDGNTIYGLLTIPNEAKPAKGWSAIIFLHGYIPPTVYTTLGQYVAYTDYLARRGFVVFKPDLRGHDKSQGEPGGAYYSEDYIIDTLNAYAAVSHMEEVNPGGIGLWGHSMSGNVVMRTFAVKPEIPAVVIWAGAVYTYQDNTKFGIHDGSYRPPQIANRQSGKRQQLRELYGDFSPDSPFWKQVAVTDYLKDLKGAIQIHHAVDDPVVNIGYSRNLMSLLDKTTVPHELFEYPEGGHNITGSAFTEAMRRTADFFHTHLDR